MEVQADQIIRAMSDRDPPETPATPVVDARDLITDFEVGSDKIDFVDAAFDTLSDGDKPQDMATSIVAGRDTITEFQVGSEAIGSLSDWDLALG